MRVVTARPIGTAGLPAGGLSSMRQIQLTVPLDPHEELERARRVLLACRVTNVIEMRGTSTLPATERGLHAAESADESEKVEVVTLVFTVPTLASGRVIDLLADAGFGVTNPAGKTTLLEVLELRSSLPAARARTARVRNSKFRLSDRTSTVEIYNSVDSKLHLTFDFLAVMVVAATVCAVGLASNQYIYVIGSMLISPLMGPIIASTFGALVSDGVMFWKGVRNELVGAAIAVVMGFAVGSACGWSNAGMCNWETIQVEEHNGTRTFPGDPDPLLYTATSLVWGVCIALPSGVGLALAIASDDQGTLGVGISIATSLLPPLVSAGLNFGLFIVHSSKPKLVQSGYGIMMFLVNWVCIGLAAGAWLRLKHVGPGAAAELLQRATRRFTEKSDAANRPSLLEGLTD